MNSIKFAHNKGEVELDIEQVVRYNLEGGPGAQSAVRSGVEVFALEFVLQGNKRVEYFFADRLQKYEVLEMYHRARGQNPPMYIRNVLKQERKHG